MTKAKFNIGLKSRALQISVQLLKSLHATLSRVKTEEILSYFLVLMKLHKPVVWK